MEETLLADIRDLLMAEGPATLADAEAIQKDAVGLTHPNLHRRMDANIAGSFDQAVSVIRLMFLDEFGTDIPTESQFDEWCSSQVPVIVPYRGLAFVNTDKNSPTYGYVYTYVLTADARILQQFDKEYALSVYDAHSYRSVTEIIHDEDSEMFEIP